MFTTRNKISASAITLLAALALTPVAFAQEADVAVETDAQATVSAPNVETGEVTLPKITAPETEAPALGAITNKGLEIVSDVQTESETSASDLDTVLEAADPIAPALAESEPVEADILEETETTSYGDAEIAPMISTDVLALLEVGTVVVSPEGEDLGLVTALSENAEGEITEIGIEGHAETISVTELTAKDGMLVISEDVDAMHRSMVE